MKKIIAFSLFGKSKLYVQGALANAIEAKTIYPDWICRFYVSPEIVTDELRAQGCEIVRKPGQRLWKPLFWRFEAASDPEVEYVIFRDTDSRVNSKEAAAVNAWIESGLNAHLMKDYPPPHATETILAGMWGIKGGVIPNMPEMILNWYRTKVDLTNKYTDQDFLRAKVFPIIKNSVLNHGVDSPAGKGTPWPPFPPMKYGEYVGQPIQP